MKPDKDFDSVDVKNKIQAQLLKEQEGMTDQEIRTNIQEMLRSSKSPMAQLWKRLQKTPKKKAA